MKQKARLLVLILFLVICNSIIYARSIDFNVELTRLREAVDQGSMSEPARMLADWYYFGFIVEQNKKEAARYYEIAAERQKEGYSMFRLAKMLMMGDGIAKNPDKGLNWLEKAAKDGNPQALLLLGYFLVEGQFCKQDVKLGIKYLETAIDKKVPGARSLLAIVTMKLFERPPFSDPELIGLLKEGYNEPLVNPLVEESPELVNQSLLIAIMLKTMKHRTSSMKENYYDWLVRSSEKGSFIASTLNAIYKLPNNKDFHDPVMRLIEVSASRDNGPLCLLIGLMKISGLGIEASYDQAQIWLRLAEEKGIPASRTLLNYILKIDGASSTKEHDRRFEESMRVGLPEIR